MQVAMGGANSELWKAAPSEVTAVHKAISSLVALPQISMDVDDKPEEHVMEGYFSSRTIRRLILESQLPPSGIDAESFSAIFWSTAIKGNCKRWAKGHRYFFLVSEKLCVVRSVSQSSLLFCVMISIEFFLSDFFLIMVLDV